MSGGTYSFLFLALVTHGKFSMGISSISAFYYTNTGQLSIVRSVWIRRLYTNQVILGPVRNLGALESMVQVNK
jgi:hypothetical protein